MYVHFSKIFHDTYILFIISKIRQTSEPFREWSLSNMDVCSTQDGSKK